ncbi:hypothetical protein OG786_16900 [Streptomyces sp. NBC_00101]|uniref:hypothetical protein n=1 Tax=Streptomyces sp. NBC_00101 TaxID=2975651 RepID=UPI0032496F87
MLHPCVVGRLAGHLPELGYGAQAFCPHAMVLAGALSASCPPPAAVLAAYEADPSPAVLGHDLRDALRLSLHSTRRCGARCPEPTKATAASGRWACRAHEITQLP